jgi:hypothetical protein
MNWRNVSHCWYALFSAHAAVACLPKDTRPTPGSLLVTATANDALLNGIPASETIDGWSIAFDRVLASLGHVSVDGDNCSSYSEARYDRVLDLLVPGPQKVSESFAIGQCDFGFRIANPADDAVRGSGVTADDIVFLRTSGSDKFAGPSGISIYVKGHASRAGVEKSFAWAFRQQLRYKQCHADPDAGTGLNLAENAPLTVDLSAHGEALFRDNPDATRAKLRFAPIADADTVTGDDDGIVTLSELSAVSLDSLVVDGSYGAPDAGVLSGKTLEDYIYLSSFPELVQFGDSGACRVSFGSGEN